MEQNSTTYSFLLRIVFFGSNRAIVPPVTPDRSMAETTSSPSSSASSSPFPNRSIFCYKTEIPGWTPISVAEFEDMLLGVVQSQPKASLKVLDAPTLLDDFFGWFCQKKKTEMTLMFHKHSPILHKQEEKNIHGGIEEEKDKIKQWRRSNSEQNLWLLLEPLRKEQLVDHLAEVKSWYGFSHQIYLLRQRIKMHSVICSVVKTRLGHGMKKHLENRSSSDPKLQTALVNYDHVLPLTSSHQARRMP